MYFKQHAFDICKSLIVSVAQFLFLLIVFWVTMCAWGDNYRVLSFNFKFIEPSRHFCEFIDIRNYSTAMIIKFVGIMLDFFIIR